MKSMKTMLKEFGEKIAIRSIDPRCDPYFLYQPKPPAKIQAKMLENK